MTDSRLHDSSLVDLARAVGRRLRRLREPLLRARRLAAHDTANRLYGTREHAEAEFARHAALPLDTPEVDARLPLLAGLAASAGADGRHVVVDVGGATGLHRVQLATLLRDGVEPFWVVVETAVYREAAARFGREGIRYAHDFDVALGICRDAGLSPTCVYSNSALQYFADPLAELERYARSGARAIVLERVPLSRRATVTRPLEQYVGAGDAGVGRTMPMALAPLGATLEVLRDAGFATAAYPVYRAAFRDGPEFVTSYTLVALKPRRR